MTAADTELPRIGQPSVPSSDPQRAFMFGLLDVVAELAGILVVNGIVTTGRLEEIMRARANLCRTQNGDQGALPAKTMAEIAALWGKPYCLAFPTDAVVIPFRRPEEDTGDAA